MASGKISLKGALKRGVLCNISEDHGLCYKCSLCDSKFTGVQPALQHLHSNKHANFFMSKNVLGSDASIFNTISKSSSHQSLRDTFESTTASHDSADKSPKPISKTTASKKKKKKKKKTNESDLDFPPPLPPPSAKSRGAANRRGAQSLNDLTGQNTNQMRPENVGRRGSPLQLLHHAGPDNGQRRGSLTGPPPGPYHPPMHHYGQPNHLPPPPHGDPLWQQSYEQNYNYPPYLSAPHPGHGPPPSLNLPNQPHNLPWSYGVPGPTATNISGVGNIGPGGNTQDIRNRNQSSGAMSKCIDVNAFLIALIKAPDQKLAMDQICRQFSCSKRALKTVCFQNNTLFKDPLQGDKSVVELFPDLKICDEYLDDSGCRSKGHCGKLHICFPFVRSMCSNGKDCDFGHNLQSNHNSQLWSQLKMECLASYINLLRTLVKKVVVSKECMSVCAPYNSTTCTNKSCSSLHICSSMFSKGAKCDLDQCSLNHDIFDPQCKAILQHFGFNIDDSKRDVITRVRVELEENSQKKQSKDEQTPRKTSTEIDSTSGSAGKSTDVPQLSFFSSIADQEAAVRAIVKTLLVTNDFWNSTDQMWKILNLKPSDFRSLIEHYSNVFCVHVSGLKVLFKLRPKLQICRHYNQGQGCDTRDSCYALHICQNFVNGLCDDDSCQLYHSLMVQPNKDIVRRCYLDGVPQKLVLNYFKRRFAIADVPNVCIPYNEERCNATECVDLHICSDKLFTVSSCFKSNCVFNHDLFDEENTTILQRYNFKNLSQREIQSVLSICVDTSLGKKAATKSAAVNKTPSIAKSTGNFKNLSQQEIQSVLSVCDNTYHGKDASTKSAAANKNPSSEKSTVLKSNDEIFKAQSTKAKTGRDQAPKDLISGITFSYALEGSVARPEICLDALSFRCPTHSQACPKLHSQVAYHWQFVFENLWYNFSVNHSNSLETAFRDVNAESVTLTPASYGSTPTEKLKFAFMDEGPLVVDFHLMGLKTRLPLNVRRLSTPSSVVCKSSFAVVYGWYFKDELGKWIEYGNSDSSMIETHASKETSTDIEQAYLSNMNSSLFISTERFDYTLNFAQMQQTNESTEVVRSIRRRPKYVLFEKFNPNDPYGLKSTKTDQFQSTKSVPDRKISSKSSESVNSRKSSKSSEGANDQNPEVVHKSPSPAGGAMGPDFPSFWSKMNKEGVECFTVDLTTREALDIISSVLFTMPNADVTRIRRLQNTFHWEAFSNQMDYFKIATKEPLNIQRLFHGTREKYVDAISKQNFEWRQSFADACNTYGRGAYFFNNAAVAHTFASDLQAGASSDAVVLAIADVFIGSVAVGFKEMTRPPPKQTGSTDLCHTTVNDLSLPTIFVKYDKSHYCPHYFVDLKF